MGQLTFSESVTIFLVRYVLSVPVLILFTPIRIAFDFFTMFHPKLFHPRNTPEKHAKKVKGIQAQVNEWNRNGRKERMCTARPTWQTFALRNYDKNTMTQINIDLEEIIEIDTKNKLLRVEPGMKMGTLTNKLVPMGWTIPVIPELESLTIGGCICGAGLETSSHKYGLFAATYISFEVVLADGSLVKCSKTENSELFEAIPMSHGTIGFLTSVTFPLIEAAKYVKVEYIHAKSIEEAETLMLAKEHEFIEGIAYDLNNSIIMYGDFANNAPPNKVNSVLKWYKPWFYKHAESFLNKPGKKHIEYIPTRDYYHRHQRAYFWEAAVGLPFGNHPLFRYTVGWIFPINFQLLKFLLPPHFLNITQKQNHILQDFVLPMSKLREAMEFSHKEVEIYPLWFCPVITPDDPNCAHYMDNQMYIDIGIYGESPKIDGFDYVDKTRRFEKFTLANKGFQGLYADVYLTRAEFDQMFNWTVYNKVRKDYNCEDAFPHVYDKISRVARGI